MTYAGSKISNALQNDNFAASFTQWKLKRGCKEGWRKQGGNWIIG